MPLFSDSRDLRDLRDRPELREAHALRSARSQQRGASRAPALALLTCLAALALGALPARAALPEAGALEAAPAGPLLFEPLASDPLAAGRATPEGEVYGRVEWLPTPPLVTGDAPGVLRARYLSTLDTGRVGWPLPRALDASTTFTAATLFVLRSEDFFADPKGFAQVAWGLWSSETTGFERVAFGPDADAFETLEFAWFPNVSPIFGGPYLSPALFGVADRDNPAFPSAGAYANATFGFGPPLPLPLDVPLVALVEHRAGSGRVVFSVHELVEGGALVPVPGALSVLDAGALAEPAYAFDRVGLLLYRDPFASPEAPSIDVTLDLHALLVREGYLETRGGLGALLGLAAPGARDADASAPRRVFGARGR